MENQRIRNTNVTRSHTFATKQFKCATSPFELVPNLKRYRLYNSQKFT